MLLAIERQIKQEFAGDMEQIRFYFCPIEEKMNPLSELLWYHYDFKINETMTELTDRIEHLTKEEGIILFSKRFNNLANTGIGEDESFERTELEMMKNIVASDYSPDQKMVIQKIFLERENHVRILNSLVARSTRILQDFAGKMEPILNEFADYWIKVTKDKDFVDYVLEEAGIDLRDDYRGGEIYPALIDSSSIRMVRDGRKNASDTLFYFGIGTLFSKEFQISDIMKNEQSKEECYQVLKVLSDKSKFDILELIRREWMYGSQIAKEINLTTATISHHMGALVENHLVEVKKIENKIFYKSNTEKIRDILA